ncbi:hypothetical protein C5C66_01755 [Rathayibacter toxicus]|uniref:DUF2029 domain-containing protein n=2 Tax=Rathayibacter toxicus TaxID=145458 RepID=A0A0C5BD13_9MICO|nr:hypothetical protein TI83_01950 [Rathayibacter toxicus]ALS57120.1 hypothetical protein APU90_04535 [Rathayibacter toxicus]KKM46068.1 hypothetical protein VT73_02960 [Rathayibacter toxicus]PPG23002.1 hypothetical protein C5D15_01730 [Rathayibacter toxicus]PPG47584.1 hypothetical protein C5D16_01725 [Rathayibacter toxicus]
MLFGAQTFSVIWMITRETAEQPVATMEPEPVDRIRPSVGSLGPLAMGTLGSLAILVGSLGVGYLPRNSSLRDWPLIATIRGVGWLTEGSAALVIGGGLLLLVAWLRLRSVALTQENGAFRAIVVVALAWAAPLLITVPLFSHDIFSYVAQGRLMVQGVDPYTNGVATIPGWFALGVDPFWANTPTPYGPLYLLIERSAVQLAGWNSPEVSIAMLRAVSVAGMAVAGMYVIRLARLRGLSLPLTAWIVVANPVTLLLFIVAGHNDSVMLALVLASLYYAHVDRRIAAVLLMGAAIAIKPIALIALPVLALIWLRHDATLRERVRLWMWSGAGALGLVIAIGLVAQVGVGWIAAMAVPGALLHWYAPVSFMCVLTSSVAEFTGHDPAAAATLVKLVALALAGLVAATLMLSKQAIDPLARLSGALLAFITASTAIHPWYVLWVLPIAALSCRWRRAHVHVTVYVSIFLIVLTLMERVDGGGGTLDQIPAHVACVAATAVAGLYLLLGYTDEERVDLGRLVHAVPFGSEMLRRLGTAGRVAERPLLPSAVFRE